MNRNLILTVVSTIIKPTFLVIALAMGTGETVLALGCDTQYRISGEISGCNSISTQELFDEINITRYQACVEELLNIELANYTNNRGDYYSNWQWQEEQTDAASQQRPTELQLAWISTCFEN